MSGMGLLAGSFDLLHAGHLMAIRYAAEKCDELYIALHIDPSIERSSKKKPVQSVFERYYQLDELEHVKEVIPYGTEEDLELIFEFYDWKYRFIGADHKHDINTGDKICKKWQIETVFIPREHNLSSSELKSRIIKASYSK